MADAAAQENECAYGEARHSKAGEEAAWTSRGNSRCHDFEAPQRGAGGQHKEIPPVAANCEGPALNT